MNLGKTLVEIRKDNKMSQEEFAEVFGVTRQTVSNWENSKSYPDIETLIKISDKFNISLDILLKGDIKMVKEIDKKIKNGKIKNILIIILILITIIFIGNYSYKIYDDYQNSVVSKYKTIVFEKDNEITKIRLKFDIGDEPISPKEWQEKDITELNAKPESVEIIEGDKSILNNLDIDLDTCENWYDIEDYIIYYMESNGYELIKFVYDHYKINTEHLDNQN